MVLCAPVSSVSWRARAAGWLLFQGQGRGGGSGKESSPCFDVGLHLKTFAS